MLASGHIAEVASGRTADTALVALGRLVGLASDMVTGPSTPAPCTRPPPSMDSTDTDRPP